MKHIRSNERVTWEKNTPPVQAHAKETSHGPAKHGEHPSYHTKHTGLDIYRETYGAFGSKTKPGKRLRIHAGKQLRNAAWYHRRILPTNHGRQSDTGRK